jgi:hypothetical protein
LDRIGVMYALVEDIAASWESYEPVAAGLERSLPPGLILHAAGRTDEGFRIIEVWASEQAWRRHAAEADLDVDCGLSAAVRHRRDLAPTHLVIGREATWIWEAHK